MGRCGSSMLRPSPNHGTPWLHNDDDDDIVLYSKKNMLIMLINFCLITYSEHFQIVPVNINHNYKPSRC